MQQIYERRNQHSRKKLSITVGTVFATILVLFLCCNARANILFDELWGGYPENVNNSNNTTVGSDELKMGLTKWLEAKSISKSLAGENSNYFDYMVQAYNLALQGNSMDTVTNHINDLPISYEEKIILFRWIYPSDSTYCQEIIDYLNERDDISYENTVRILEQLGFTVDSNGTVYWD